jgi:uncharacterized protein
MDITPLMRPELKIIQSYGTGFFRVNGEILKHHILVTDETVTEWMGGQDPLQVSDDVRALKGRVDILLIGMGTNFPVLPPSKRAQFEGLGMTVDIMDTASACRTYNVLTAEGRRVAAALVVY